MAVSVSTTVSVEGGGAGGAGEGLAGGGAGGRAGGGAGCGGDEGGGGLGGGGLGDEGGGEGGEGGGSEGEHNTSLAQPDSINGADSTVMPSSSEAAAAVPRVDASACSTAAVVLAGTAMAAMMITLA